MPKSTVRKNTYGNNPNSLIKFYIYVKTRLGISI